MEYVSMVLDLYKEQATDHQVDERKLTEAQNLLSVEITRSKVINCSSERLKALQELKNHVDYIKYELNG